jgi:hypothetical protein
MQTSSVPNEKAHEIEQVGTSTLQLRAPRAMRHHPGQIEGKLVRHRGGSQGAR